MDVLFRGQRFSTVEALMGIWLLSLPCVAGRQLHLASVNVQTKFYNIINTEGNFLNGFDF